LETLSDNALMLKVKGGDLDRLGSLFERYKKPLFGFFYGMNRDSALSEDLVQNVFFRILKYRYLFRGEGDFRTWLFHIARNVNNDHYRKNRLGKAEAVEKWHDQLVSDDPHTTYLQQQEESQLLTAALEKLPPDKREILLLSKFQEKKYSEIGVILGCSEGAVKVKVFRALQELRVVYKQLEKHA
jgi:RNA polymerase sigma factor (sigma-70 family)